MRGSVVQYQRPEDWPHQRLSAGTKSCVPPERAGKDPEIPVQIPADSRRGAVMVYSQGADEVGEEAAEGNDRQPVTACPQARKAEVPGRRARPRKRPPRLCGHLTRSRGRRLGCDPRLPLRHDNPLRDWNLELTKPLQVSVIPHAAPP